MYEFQELPEPTLSTEAYGSIATVTIGERKVTFRAGSGVSIQELHKKANTHTLFNKLTSSIPGLLHQEMVLNPDGNSYDMSKAPGVNLSSDCLLSQGKMAEYANIDTPTKIKALITYLKTIDTLNKAGYKFSDHKSDSVFIDPATGNISIVDTDQLTKLSGNVEFEETNTSLIGQVIVDFFTRGCKATSEGSYLNEAIPAKIALIVQYLDQVHADTKNTGRTKSKYNSLNDIVTEIENWMANEPDSLISTLPYPNKSKDYIRMGLSVSVKSANEVDPNEKNKLQEKINAFNWSSANEPSILIFQAEIFRLLFLHSEASNSDRLISAMKRRKNW